MNIVLIPHEIVKNYHREKRQGRWASGELMIKWNDGLHFSIMFFIPKLLQIVIFHPYFVSKLLKITLYKV